MATGYYYKVIIDKSIPLECLGDENTRLRKGDWCILQDHGREEYGQLMIAAEHREDMPGGDLARILRRATLRDQGKAHENQVRSKSLHRTGQEMIKKHDLPMDLVSTHLAFDRKHVLFVFLAPGRVDFRELLKDLKEQLHMRVELRQIGPRDQAGMVGGLGSCGRPLCCATFLKDFVSINVKMAKTQQLSLNPSSIIGACARLKCCLNYEYAGYKELAAKLPRVGRKCTYGDERGRVIGRNPLMQTVTVKFQHGDRIAELPVTEIALERN